MKKPMSIIVTTNVTDASTGLIVNANKFNIVDSYLAIYDKSDDTNDIIVGGIMLEIETRLIQCITDVNIKFDRKILYEKPYNDIMGWIELCIFNIVNNHNVDLRAYPNVIFNFFAQILALLNINYNTSIYNELMQFVLYFVEQRIKAKNKE